MITYVIILIAVIALAIPSVILVNKFPASKGFFKVLFAILIVVFGYLLFRNVTLPIQFEKELDMRSNSAVIKLKDIRTIQMAYKDKYGSYTGGFDTLISFVKEDSIAIESEKIVGVWNQDEMTKEQAYKAGVIVKTASYVRVADSLWKESVYPIEEIGVVPFLNGKEFIMDAGVLVTGSKVKVKVFECYVLYKDLLEGFDKQLVSNYIDGQIKYGGFPGIRVGSLTEATNNAGNWEQ